MNAPETWEGKQVWDLVKRLGGQMRATSGGLRPVVTGWDMSAALAMARALNIAPWLAAEVLPEIEMVMVKSMNQDGAGRA